MTKQSSSQVIKQINGVKSYCIFTVGVSVSNQKLEHLVHGAHEEDEPQLGHCHGNETPQEDGRTHRMREWH